MPCFAGHFLFNAMAFVCAASQIDERSLLASFFTSRSSTAISLRETVKNDAGVDTLLYVVFLVFSKPCKTRAKNAALRKRRSVLGFTFFDNPHLAEETHLLAERVRNVRESRRSHLFRRCISRPRDPHLRKSYRLRIPYHDILRS